MSYDGYIDDGGKLVYTGPEKIRTAEEMQQAVAALSPKPDHRKWFREGQEMEIDGHIFRVKRVKPAEITIKLVERRKD